MSALLSDRKCLNDERNPDCDEYLMAWDNAKRCPECRALRRNRLARERYALRQQRQREGLARLRERDPFGRRVFRVL